MINFYNYLTDKKVSQSLYEMLFDKFMQSDTPTYREYTGTLPVTITANGSDLVDWIIYGNTDGVGNKTANLLNTETSEQSCYYDASGVYHSAAAHDESDYIPIVQGESYTFYTYKAGSLAYGIFINAYDSNKEFSSNIAALGNPTFSGYYTFVAPITGYVRFNYLDRSGLSANTMFYEGSSQLSYEPYGYKITIFSNSEPTDIYIDAPLGANETVSFTDTNVHIPTNNGSTVISCDNTVQPEKMYIKYIGG